MSEAKGAPAEVEPAKDEPKVKVIRINKAELWPDAKTITGPGVINSSRGKLKINLRAISYAENEQIKIQNPYPTPPTVDRGRLKMTDEKDPKYQAAMNEMQLRRHVAQIDLCALKIPGDSIESKLQFISENFQRPGEIGGLCNHILTLSGLDDGEVTDGEVPETTIENMEAWVNATKAPTIYQFILPGVRYEFELRGIPGQKLKGIDASTDPGEPPYVTVRDPDGRKGRPKRNPEDPGYKRKIDECAEKRMMMMLEAALGFEFPGENMSKKLAWLTAKPAFQIINLYNFLQGDVLSYRSQVDFS